MKHRDYHKWWFMSGQTIDDLALFTTWDSAEDSNNQIAGKFQYDLTKQ